MPLAFERGQCYCQMIDNLYYLGTLTSASTLFYWSCRKNDTVQLPVRQAEREEGRVVKDDGLLFHCALHTWDRIHPGR